MRRRTFVGISITLLATSLLLAPASAEAQGHWGSQVLRPNAPQAGLIGPASPRDSRGAPAGGGGEPSGLIADPLLP